MLWHLHFYPQLLSMFYKAMFIFSCKAYACRTLTVLTLERELRSQPTTVLVTDCSWVMKVVPQRGGEGGHTFKSCDISHKNKPTSHAISLTLYVYACNHSTLPPLCVCSCQLQEMSKCAFLHLLVPPLSHNYFFIASYLAWIGGRTFGRKTFFAITSFKKGSWLTSWDYGIHLLELNHNFYIKVVWPWIALSGWLSGQHQSLHDFHFSSNSSSCLISPPKNHFWCHLLKWKFAPSRGLHPQSINIHRWKLHMDFSWDYILQAHSWAWNSNLTRKTIDKPYSLLGQGALATNLLPVISPTLKPS